MRPTISMAYAFLFVGRLSRSSCRANNNLFGARKVYTSSLISSGYSRQASTAFCHHIHHQHSRRQQQHIISSPTFSRHYASTFSTSSDDVSKWEFISSSPDDDQQQQQQQVTNNLIRNILVVGDGDLSYSAEISPELQQAGINLYATVLEDESTHNTVYQYSKSNTDIINSHGHDKPLFGIDATSLCKYFDSTSITFDRIQFNFPHWRGKANNRYNRALLNDFLASAVNMLSDRGEIHVALCDGQGGCSATTLQEWKGSWTASLYGGENGLLLAKIFPYDATYNLSAHRGVDRAFKLGKEPSMHVFVKPNNTNEGNNDNNDMMVVQAPKEIQLCCRHELHIVLPEDYDGASSICSLDQIIAGDAIQQIIQDTCVPDGVRVEVPARQMLELHESHGEASRIAVFLVVYCSESSVVTRQLADDWREAAETEVAKCIPLRENRRGRSVSRPFPYPALHPEIKYHTTGIWPQRAEAICKDNASSE